MAGGRRLQARRAPRRAKARRCARGTGAAAAPASNPAPTTVPSGGRPEIRTAPHVRPAAARRARRADRRDRAADAGAPVSGEMVLAHLPPTRRAGTKPFFIEGLDTETGEWEPPAPGRRYGELQAGVQLASRSGALNEIEYSEFVQKVQAFADAVGAMPDFPTCSTWWRARASSTPLPARWMRS
jgi:hypothetical protein